MSPADKVPVAILGAGDLGQTLAAHLATSGQWRCVGFYDDTLEPGTQVTGLPVLGAIQPLKRQHDPRGPFDRLVMGIGYKHLEARASLFAALVEAGHRFAAVVHESAYVHPTATVADGAVLFPRCVLDVGARAESNSVLNAGCVIAHDTTVGADTFLGPAVNLAGYVTVGRECFLGIGTTVIDNVTIHDRVQTGGGTVVTQDLTEPGLYVGAPARRVR